MQCCLLGQNHDLNNIPVAHASAGTFAHTKPENIVARQLQAMTAYIDPHLLRIVRLRRWDERLELYLPILNKISSALLSVFRDRKVIGLKR